MQSKKTNPDRNTESSNTPFVQHEDLDKMIAYFSVNDLPIEELDLSVRTYNCLKNNKIFYISQVLTLTNKMFDSIQQLGNFARKEITESIQNLLNSGDVSEFSDDMISNTSKANDNISSVEKSIS